MKLSIVIPVYNNYNFTSKCLEDLSHLPKDHEIIVVDNGSTDSTRKLKSEGRVIVIKNKKNLGFAAAVNIGYSVSSGEYVMFLNNDIRVRSDKETWTQPLIEEASKGGLIGPTVGVLDERFNFITEASKMPSRGLVYMSGWNITASSRTWDRLVLEGEQGPFNSMNFFSYFEDTDLSFRAKESDIPFKIVNCPVHHFGRVTGKKLNLSKMYMESKKTFIKLWENRIEKSQQKSV